MKKIFFVTILVTSQIACSPGYDDIDRYIDANEYEALYAAINSPNFEKKIQSTPKFKGLYDRAVVALAFSNTTFKDSITNNHLITNEEFIRLINDEINERYRVDHSELLSFLISKPEILAAAKAVIIEEAGLRNTEYILGIADSFEIEIENELVNKFNRIVSEIDTIETRHYREDRELNDLNEKLDFYDRRDEYLRNEYEYAIEAKRTSYTFEGYINALFMSAGDKDIYEVLSLNGTIYLLTTTDAKFQRKGLFRLKVFSEGKTIPMKMSEGYGGFERDIPVIIEYYDALNERFEEYWIEYVKVRDDREAAQARINYINRNRNVVPDKYESLLVEKRSQLAEAEDQLFTWIKENLN